MDQHNQKHTSLLLLPKHTPQRHLGAPQQRNTQRKPTRRRIQRRRLAQRRCLHLIKRILVLRSRRCSRERRHPLIHRRRRGAPLRTRGGVHGRTLRYFRRGRWIVNEGRFRIRRGWCGGNDEGRRGRRWGSGGEPGLRRTGDIDSLRWGLRSRHLGWRWVDDFRVRWVHY